LLVGEELDAQVREYVKESRKFGVVINAHIVIAVGMGLVISQNYWWKMAATLGIGQNTFFSRMGFVKRKTNTKSKVLVRNYISCLQPCSLYSYSSTNVHTWTVGTYACKLILSSCLYIFYTGICSYHNIAVTLLYKKCFCIYSKLCTPLFFCFSAVS